MDFDSEHTKAKTPLIRREISHTLWNLKPLLHLQLRINVLAVELFKHHQI